MVVVLVRIPAEDDRQAVKVGRAGRDHRQRPLPRRDGDEIANAPAGENVGLDMHLIDIVPVNRLACEPFSFVPDPTALVPSTSARYKLCMRRSAIHCIGVITALAIAARAAESGQETIRKYAEMERQVAKLFFDKNYEEALAECREMTELMPRESGPHYNIACAYARLGKNAEAMTALGRATELGYNDPSHMREDDDLAALRPDAKFADLLAKARENERKGPYEKGKDIAGVKMIEDFPEGGLRYRLRLGMTASKQRPHRLVVWLHPSGGSMNSVVETMSPKLAEHGYALVVFTQKQWMGWTGPEAQRLIDKTLPELAKVEGLDARRPILLGFSAGGQIALQLWKSSPQRFGGLVLDAAYPINMAQSRPGKMAVLGPPPDAGQTPIYVIVGEKDQNGAGWGVWKNAAGPWLKAGVPLRIRHVPEKGHQWLFGPAETADLLAWLDDLAAGKLPKDVATTQPL